MRIVDRTAKVTPAAAAILFGLVFGCPSVLAQAPAKPKPKAVSPNEIKRLDSKMEQLREEFLRDTTSLIKAYEDAGQPERARVLLEALGRLDPKNEAIQQKLSELQAAILDGREFELELDPGKSWHPVGRVAKGEMLRIRVSGEYTCKATITSGPDGAPTGNPAEDVVDHVPLGAVMAVVASGTVEKDGKPPRPFTVGKSHEKPVERDGMLFLKVNLPPKGDCTGKLTVRISGATRPQ